MINKFVIGNEKAIIGGIVAAILALASLVGVTGQMTVKEAASVVATWIFTHVTIWLTTNSSKPSDPKAPVV